MTDSLQELLSELLAEDRAATIARTSETFDDLTRPFERRMVIFGTGQLGRFVLPALRRAGIEPLAFCDNNSARWGSVVDGVTVMSPADAMEKFGDSACFLLAAYNASPLMRQLKDMGCQRIVTYPIYFWKHSSSLPQEERLELPYRILEQAGEIPSGFELLADDVSRNEFLTQLRWRCLMDYDCLPAHEPPADMYFSPDIVQLTNEEVLIDCGAFDGDSVKLFLDRVNSRFRRILAMEPDPTNQKALAAYVASLPAETSAKIEVFPYALGKESRTVWFRADGTVSSKITDNKDGVEVQVRRLDDLLEGSECPTIIKMDIEGAEVDAIPGAAKTIARCRPILAVCAYHRCEHLWQIPKLLQAANPGYRIFLRRYAEECWETVYYAIPPERLV